jgi:allophanate hydrolase subunit 2
MRIEAPSRGVRTYIALRGGIAGGTMARRDIDKSDDIHDIDDIHEIDDIDSLGDQQRVLIEPVLGSLSSDVLGRIGPPPLLAGAHLWLGHRDVAPITVDVAPIAAPPATDDVVSVPIVAGPRLDWCERAIDALTATRWTVGPDSNRVGIRLIGDRLHRRVTTELRSEPLIAGAIQIPPDGQPIVFGPDHPTTGGYPVVALVVDGGLDRLAQARPGQIVRFRTTP